MALSKPPIDAPIVEPRTGRGTDRFNRWLLDLWSRVGGSLGIFAPASAKYITQTHNSDLTNEQALADLDSGFLKVTTGSGVLSSTGTTKLESSDMSATLVTTSEVGDQNNIPVLTFDEAGRCINANTARVNLRTLPQSIIWNNTQYDGSFDIRESAYIGKATISLQSTLVQSDAWYSSQNIPDVSLTIQVDNPSTYRALSIANQTTGASLYSSKNGILGTAIIKLRTTDLDFTFGGLNLISRTTGRIVTLQHNASQSFDYTFTLPIAPPSVNNYALVSSTTGVLSFLEVAANTFKTISVAGQSDVVADSATDTLTLVAGTGMTITTNATTDTITLASSGGSGVDTFAYTFAGGV